MAAQLPRQTGAVDVSAFLEALNPANRHTFLQPPPSIPTGSLQIVKDTLDAFAGQISDEQLQRLKLENKNKKRKRPEGPSTEVLKIRKVHLDGFETGQVWQQARRIIQSALAHSEEALLELVERDEVVIDDDEEDDEDVSEPEETELASTSGEEDGEDVESLEGDDSELEDDIEEDGVDVASDDEEETFGDLGSGDEEMEDGEEEEEDDDDDEDEDDVGEFVEDPHGLNDGFFSIDDFNKQTQWFEEQDAKGDPNTDAVSDEEEINWDVDPLDAKASKSGKSSKLDKADVDGEEFGFDQEEDDDDEEEEDGPTFGNMDLNAPEGDSEDEAMGDDDEEDVENNANNVFYKDFFAPPPRKASKDKKGKNVRFKTKPIQEEDVERAMKDIRRDLFEDESDIGEDSDDVLSDVSAGEPRSRRSAHERRQAKLSEEIRKLEAAAVAKREWAMSGEATAVDRPVNSLLDEQLDFEHAGKPIPVITQEITDSIEELIKRRILAQEFDEVLRRRPDAASVAAGTRRGLVEVDDTKSSKGLAEIYEDEHQKNLDPDGFVSKADEKTQKEEAEVARMWKDLNATLDSLSSWQYRPPSPWRTHSRPRPRALPVETAPWRRKRCTRRAVPPARTTCRRARLSPRAVCRWRGPRCHARTSRGGGGARRSASARRAPMPTARSRSASAHRWRSRPWRTSRRVASRSSTARARSSTWPATRPRRSTRRRAAASSCEVRACKIS
jgi:U3 small nucleolar RNA-associated protein MPP10